MQTAILSQLSCSLVPHSTRPFWHQWENHPKQQNNENKPNNNNSARRRLFREEESGEEENNKQFVQRLLAELAERYKQKWNFDFENGHPIENNSTNTNQQHFEYDAMPGNQVPGFYRISTLFGQMPKNGQPPKEADENYWSPTELKNELGTKNNKFGESEFGNLDGQMKMEDSVKSSPSRVLRKPKRRPTNQTPKRRNSSNIGWAQSSGGGQSKLTDFLKVRKGLARSATKEKANEQQHILMVDSPKRRRHSLGMPMPTLGSPIKKAAEDFQRAKRRSQRHFQVRQALFKCE